MSSFSPALGEVLEGLPDVQVAGDPGIAIAALTARSADVERGSLFFCVPGRTSDGHDLAGEAVARGAVAVVAERRLALPEKVTQVLVPSVAEAAGPIAAAFHGRPADRMTVVGVTGTNGKTTVTYLLDGVFRAAGRHPGVVGTTGAMVDGRPHPQQLTTPDALSLQQLLGHMRESGVQAVAMEVTSIGLDQHRVGGIRFACAVFTNLSRDHLDYHGTPQEYLAAKATLFTPERAATAAINHDSPEGRSLIREEPPTLTYGVGQGAQLRAEDVASSSQGVRFRVDGVEVRSPLRGAFNVHNCLAALAAAKQVGIPLEIAARGIGGVPGVPGRMEPVQAGQPFEVLVDYAHTPDSLENALRTVRQLAAANRVIAVFGCGGDRDRGKRPQMGEVATRHADLAVITSDNPRSEDPTAIIREIEPGARRGGGSYAVEPDRRTAIRMALSEAGPGDVVLIAGKGHETGQQFADRTIPFDDRVVAREELEALTEVRG
ncbi:MAG TPA: UDP-N-acetylmuramoyl-L-alanyl-D-glutamate--2,6-diaminopimelate ligase [Actinomycetota bacterium]|nr:UDP-N-acetylmuramoyl-L-alanyl-D-glutamate--2,6-diaminopimelate ligase [Actinomycetota bacterium]